MEILLYIALFTVFMILFAVVILLTGTVAEDNFTKYLAWLKKTLNDLFLPGVSARAGELVVIITVLFGIVGFLLPGNLVGFDEYTLNRAIKMNGNGKYIEALELLDRFRDSKSPLAFNELGVSYLGLNEPKQAVSVLNKSIELNENYVKAQVNLARAYSMLEKETDASFQLRKAKALRKYTLDEATVYGVRGNDWKLIPRALSFGLLALIGMMLPGVIVFAMKRSRIKQFDSLLPEGLVMATNGLRAGLSIGQVFEVLSKEAPKPLNQEFSLIVNEQRLGRNLDDSLKELANRIPTDDTMILVNSTIILRESGGNLTEVFENLADTIRERKLLKQKIAAMTAEGKTQAVILVILPVILGWILSKLSPKEFDLLLNTPLGIMILVFMVIWGGIGGFFMWKTTQVKI